MTATRAPAVVTGQRPAPRRAADPMAGRGTMLRLVWRRNRVRLLVWFVVLVGLFVYVEQYYKSIFTTQEKLDDFAAVSNVPAIKALTGLAAAPNTLGGAVWTKVWMTCALTLAFAVLFLVTRNGRADEEAGRTELLRSRMLGVHAASTAAWIATAALCLAVGVGVAAASALGGLDPEGTGITGSLIMGASMAGVGLIAIGVGALSGQLATTSRGATMLGSVVIGMFYVLRMIGDLGDGKLTWLSPIGWAQEMQPWGANRWWPLGLILLATALLLAVATRIEASRDLGAGLLPERAGPGAAPRWYAHPTGLGVRLQRGPIIGWAVTIVLCALLFGSVVDAMLDFVDDAGGSVSAVLRGTGVDALLALLVTMIAMVTSVFAIQTTLVLRGDEASGIVEPQLAGALSRTRWALGRLAIPVIGTAALLLAGGAFMGAGYGSSIDDPGQVWELALAALAYWPAVMVFVGIGVALFGWVPRLAVALSWAALVAMWFVVLVGDALHLPDWLLNLLPFQATPYQPYEAMSWPPVIAMTVFSGALVAIGLYRFRQRDIEPG